MKKLIFLLAIIFLAALAGYSQDCPPEKVCISPAAARQALIDSDTVTAQKVELAAKDQAIEDLRKLLHDVEIQLAKIAGEKSQLEQDRVRWTAVLDLLIKQARPKKVGLINLF